MDGIELMTKQNWKLRGAMAAGVGAAGGLVSVGSLIGFGNMVTRRLEAPVFVVAAVFSAGLAGFLLGPLMGREGWRGVLVSFVASLMATVLAAYLAGFLALPLYNLGLVTLWLTLHFLTPFALLWIALCAGLHWSAGRLRRRFT